MDRRALLAAVSTLAVAGCLADDAGERTEGGADGGTATGPDATNGPDETTPAGTAVRDRFAGEPVRPECEKRSETIEARVGDETREFETAATIPYPDAPSEFAGAAIVDYVVEFERAYVRHAALCDRQGSGHVLSVSYDVRRSETLEWDTDPTIAFLLRAGAASSGVDSAGEPVWVSDIGYKGVVYAVDETGAARTEADGPVRPDPDEFEAAPPNPLEAGELVATFE